MRLRAHRSLQLAVLALGLLSAASNCGFLVRAVSATVGSTGSSGSPPGAVS
jgi:hypothetical protein